LRYGVAIGTFLLSSFISVYPVKAAPSKPEIDAHARGNGFPRSDYPYYEPVNQCGGEGATSAVPDKYEVASNVPAPTLQDPFRTRRVVIFRADFNNACNTHDRCYMTAGKAREDCDAQFNRDLLSACRNPVIPEPTSVATCVALAQTYANTVYAAGAAFYPNAQAQARRYNSLVNNFIAQSQTNSSFRIRNRWNPYCLASIGNSKEIDNRIGMGTCDSSNSIWRWDGQQLRNGWNPNCLGSIGNSKEIDNRVVMGSCGQSNAVWRWDGQQIRNGWNPYCLGSIGNSKAVDNPVVMGSCGQSNAQWYTEKIQ
jgi:hypothetical protein